MLLGLTLLVLISSLLVYYDPEAAWNMISSWWRKAAKPAVTSPPDQQRPDHDTMPIGTQAQVATDDGDATPKAKPLTNGAPVPQFSLEAPSNPAQIDEDSSDEEIEMPPPQFPSLNSAQRASNPTSSSANSLFVPRTGPSLMPPPPRPASTTANPRLGVPSTGLKVASLSSSLRVPTTGPLPNRGPPSSSPASSLAAPLTTSVPPPNPRKKVILSPGHSPLDWANLQKTNSNLSGVPSLQRVTPSMLKAKNGRKGRPTWSSYKGRVYNMTPYLSFHPGGEGELKRAAGKDGEKLFMDVHPWVNWDNMLESCLVGIMVSENDPRAGMGSQLDDMD
ncbi:hypothetical protein BT63DRAFT_429141 [Microthyrium microscopicum]|uniref:Cytochrome b5 heme-binding domain-containing protein n=1 Tax=Microthyrium microscopicum TaxID=703497 RepID=A0A6A6U257_9PEZI|nr:hypothetical protein BT63DRAFT_429141 [Microthyrium microscopicum]